MGGGWGVRQEAVRTIRIGTYNIRNIWNGRLESDLRGMLQTNVDLGIFHKTKVTEGIYTQELSGYSVVALEAPSTHSRGVAVFYCAEEHFLVEALQLYGANVVSFQISSG